MSRSHWLPLVSLLFSGCATTTPGSQPHEMSAREHELEATKETKAANEHESQYDPAAGVLEKRCGGARGACWTSVVNPTQTHLQEAEEHRKNAAAHRAGSQALRDAEAQSCAGLSDEDRDMSPFIHTDDIVDVHPFTVTTGIRLPVSRTVGAVVVFRALPGLTAEWLQRVVDCHIARNSALGHIDPTMPNCPLVPRDVKAQVRSTGNGFAVEIQSSNPDSVKDIIARAERLITK